MENLKDKFDNLNKSGIYKIDCLNCNNSYIGQTKRSLQVRFKEHIADTKYKRLEKSSVALHMDTFNHKIDKIKLIRNVKNSNQLDAAESLEILKFRNNLFNNGTGPIPSSVLLDYVVDWSKNY